jgi:hypothetical protein
MRPQLGIFAFGQLRQDRVASERVFIHLPDLFRKWWLSSG